MRPGAAVPGAAALGSHGRGAPHRERRRRRDQDAAVPDRAPHAARARRDAGAAAAAGGGAICAFSRGSTSTCCSRAAGGAASPSPARRTTAELLELHVRRVSGGGFTQRLFGDGPAAGGGLTVGSLLRIEGPIGQFSYRPGTAPVLMVGRRHRLCAAQIDAAAHARDRHPPRHPLLLGRAPRRRPVRGEARARVGGAATHSSPSPPCCRRRMSPRPPPPRRLGARCGARRLPRLERFEVYAAGPPAMIEAMRASFPRHGLPAERLYFDSFDYAPDAVSPQPERRPPPSRRSRRSGTWCAPSRAGASRPTARWPGLQGSRGARARQATHCASRLGSCICRGTGLWVPAAASSFPKSSRQHAEQARRLRSEGVDVRSGRVPRAALIDLEQRGPP